MKKPTKYEYLKVLQGFYQPGQWEDLTQAENSREGRKEIRDDLRAYRQNQPGRYRIINRREIRQAAQ